MIQECFFRQGRSLCLRIDVKKNGHSIHYVAVVCISIFLEETKVIAQSIFRRFYLQVETILT